MSVLLKKEPTPEKMPWFPVPEGYSKHTVGDIYIVTIEMRQWIMQNIKGNWTTASTSGRSDGCKLMITFAEMRDATIYKMFWT